MRRLRGVLQLVVSILCVPLLAGCGEREPVEPLQDRQPGDHQLNIVLVLVDTLRADWTEPYGDEPGTTPELQRWAERGILFERALAQSSWTKISMASLFTSLWPRSHGVRRASDGLGEGALTLAEILSDAGYRTYGVQSNGWLDQSFGFQQGFDHYVFPRAPKKDEGLGKASRWPHAARVFAEGERLIDAHPRDQPFFLYLHFMDVHEYAAPPEYRKSGVGLEETYRASIRWLDDVMAQLVAKLEADGLADSTVIIFASDHGETFGENQMIGHAHNVFTPVLHVPLLIRTPEPIGPIRVPTQVRNIDIAPTVLELAGIPVPPGFDGESLMPLVGASEPFPDRTTFAALGEPILPGAVEQVSVNDGEWTLARNLDGSEREFLFERALDPMEDANLVEFEPEFAARMRAILDAHLAVEPQEDARVEGVSIDPSIAEALRAVGYLQ